MPVDNLPGPTITERLLLLARLLKFDPESDPVCHLQRRIPAGVPLHPRLQSRDRRQLVSTTTLLPPRRVLNAAGQQTVGPMTDTMYDVQ